VITLTWGHLLTLALGGVVGWVLAVVVRRIRVAAHACRFCNGHGYTSGAQESKVMDQVHEESARFRP
jgi:fatty-acid desaturase